MLGQTNSNQRAGNYNNLPGQRKRAQWSKALTTQFYKICVELTEKGIIVKRQGLLTECQKWIIAAMMWDSMGVRYTANQIANKWDTAKNLYDTNHKKVMLPYYTNEFTRRVRHAGKDFLDLKDRPTPHAELLEISFGIPIKFVNNEPKEVATGSRDSTESEQGEQTAKGVSSNLDTVFEDHVSASKAEATKTTNLEKKKKRKRGMPAKSAMKETTTSGAGSSFGASEDAPHSPSPGTKMRLFKPSKSTTPEPSSGAIGSGGASASAAANVDQWSPAKFGKKATVTGAGPMSPAVIVSASSKDAEDVAVGGAVDENPPHPDGEREVDSPQREVGETAAAGAVGSGQVHDDTRRVTADVLDFTGTGLEDSILADKEDLKKLHDARQTYVDALFSLAERAHQRASAFREGVEARRKAESQEAELKHVKEEVRRVKQEAADQLVKAKQEAAQLLRQKEADLEAEKEKTLEAKGYLEAVIKGANETEKKLCAKLKEVQ